ncbi:hypothetical protein EDD11_007766 [Mortierella claussenii]|nr:hypothetical protein EDD11_007766 [Mortierella claussenii]
MDCSLIPGIDGPTKVLFAVPFNVPYFSKGKKRRLKVVAKIQFLISSLVPNDVAAVQSRIEVLSSFDAPELLHSISEIEKQEPITAYIERVTKKITEHFERAERAKQMKKVFVEALSTTFRDNLLECDLANYTFASFLFSVPKDKTRPEPYSTAVATFYVSDNFPDEYPKLTLTAPMVPGAAYKSTPPPEVVPISRYSPRWPAERIIMEIWEQLWEEIPRYYTKMAHTMASSS